MLYNHNKEFEGTVRHERAIRGRRVKKARRYAMDEGRPLGIGLQGQVPNHLKLRRLRSGVVSVKEKVPQDGIRCESGR